MSKPKTFQPHPDLLAQFEGFDDRDHSAAWQASRRNAQSRLRQSGLPTRHQEDWKYTDITGIFANPWKMAQTNNSAPPHVASDIICHNGCFSVNSLPEGISFLPASEAHDDFAMLLDRTNLMMESSTALLNRALLQEGAILNVDDENSKKKLTITFINSCETDFSIAAPRLWIRIAASCEVELAITHLSQKEVTSLNLPAIDIDLAPNARLTLLVHQNLSPESFQLATTRIHLQRDATLNSLDAAFGGALARHELNVTLEDSGIEATINGIYAIKHKQLTDFHTVIEHRKPNSRSHQVYKGILDDESKGVFNGLVEVHPGASGTDGYQLNRTLLKSNKAIMNTKPELRIDNDDVKCSHGATVGQLDPAQLFYLHSRAIEPNLAEHLLSRAFIEDLVYLHPSAQHQSILHEALNHWQTPEETA